MKKLLLIAGLALGLAASAQTEKGSWMIGGNLGDINLGFGKSTTNFSIGVEPIGLYFITDNLGIGGRIPIGIGINSASGGNNHSTFRIGIAPTIRYYFTNVGKGKIFGEAALDFLEQSNTDKIGSTSTTKSSSATGFSLGVGYNYFFNPHVALEAGLRYVDTRVSGTHVPYNVAGNFGATNGTFNDNNINVTVGLQIFFPKHAKNSVKSFYKKKK